MLIADDLQLVTTATSHAAGAESVIRIRRKGGRRSHRLNGSPSQNINLEHGSQSAFVPDDPKRD